MVAFRYKTADLSFNVETDLYKERIEKQARLMAEQAKDVLYPCSSFSVAGKNFTKADFDKYSFNLDKYFKQKKED